VKNLMKQSVVIKNNIDLIITGHSDLKDRKTELDI